MQPFFSILVVCLNPGDKLKVTLESIENQSFQDYEVIVKDGISTDGSLTYAEALLEKWQGEKKLCRLKLVSKKDSGIYDAMNQAAEAADGKYVYFLNCGDRFYSETVLAEMADFIRVCRREGEGSTIIPGIYYGNIYERLTGQQVTSNPHMDAFGCYRNVPCHQACFYDRRLLMAHPFETRYRVRADYEQFLWCFFTSEFQEKVDFQYKEMLIADYEGGGFSETKENRRISAREHKEITGKYMTRGQLFKFRLILWLTLAPIRTKLAENEKTAGIYNRLKKILYLRK